MHKKIVLLLMVISLILSGCQSESEPNTDQPPLKEEPWSLVMGIRSEGNEVTYQSLVISFDGSQVTYQVYDKGLLYPDPTGLIEIRSFQGDGLVKPNQDDDLVLTSEWSKISWQALGQRHEFTHFDDREGLYTRLQSFETIDAIVDGQVVIRKDEYLMNPAAYDLVTYEVGVRRLDTPTTAHQSQRLDSFFTSDLDQSLQKSYQAIEDKLLAENADKPSGASHLVINQENLTLGRAHGAYVLLVPIDEVTTYGSGESLRQFHHFEHTDISLKEVDLEGGYTKEAMIDFYAINEANHLLVSNQGHIILKDTHGQEDTLTTIGVGDKILYIEPLSSYESLTRVQKAMDDHKGSWIVNDSDMVMINPDYLRALSGETLELAFAEIGARVGQGFTGDLKTYFESQPWYRHLDSPLELNAIETENQLRIMEVLSTFNTALADLDQDGLMENIHLETTDTSRLVVNTNQVDLAYPIEDQALVVGDLDPYSQGMDILIGVKNGLPTDYFTLHYTWHQGKILKQEVLKGVFYTSEEGDLKIQRFLNLPLAVFAYQSWPIEEGDLWQMSSFHQLKSDFLLETQDESLELIQGQIIEFVQTDGISKLEFTTLDGKRAWLTVNDDGTFNQSTLKLSDLLTNME